mgnify:FL=1
MRTRWKMARERKKKDIPESNQKRRKKENIFDIWSTFSSFSEEKKVKIIHFWIDRATLHFFFVVVLSWFCCLWREKINRPRMKRRERGERGKENFTRHHRRQSQSRDSLESNKQHQKHQMMMTMTRNRTTTTTTKKTMRFLLLAFLLCFCFATTFAFGEEPQSKSQQQQQQPKLGLPNGEVIELNDSNFDKYVNKGTAEQLPVIIDVYATWCVHCKQLEPVWRELARELQSEVYVGKIDGEKERALANRLSANKGFPTIILLHQNKMRFYSGERSVEKLTHFCRKGWREVKPEPWHKTANNWFGQIFGLVHKVPGVLKGMYSQFSKDYSDTQILFMALSVPVVSGMLLIWVADAITVRRTVSRSRRYVAEQELIRRRAAQAAAHPHAE